MVSVHQQLEKWREDLINLTRANRLLYFRRTKTSTLEILQPNAGPLLDRLYGRAEPKRLEIYGSRPEEDDDEALQLALDERRERRPPSPWEVVTGTKDPVLVRKTLRNLDRRAKQEFLDKGLWILYLGVGFLRWREDVLEKEEESLTPLFLFPVALEAEARQGPFVVHRTEDDATMNPALAVKLEHDFGIQLPLPEELEDADINELLSNVAAAVRDHPKWQVEPTVVLAPFSFHKEVIYKDLRDNAERIAAHTAVQALAGDPSTKGEFEFDPLAEEKLDEEAPPEDTVTIRDADASQRQCIVAARDGHSFVMDGPPGTGKSQTISNMIVELLAKGRTVLFVSEKAAALDVVHKRLAEAGVSDFCLPLHSHKATRKEVAQALGKALLNDVVPTRVLGAPEKDRLRELRRQLSDYALALNQIRDPLGLSAFQVVGRLAQLDAFPQAPPAESGAMTSAQYSEVRDLGVRLSGCWDPVGVEGFLWKDLKAPQVDGGVRASARDAAQQAQDRAATLATVATRASLTSVGMGCEGPGAAAVLLRLVEHLGTPGTRPPNEWLWKVPLPEVIARIHALRELAAERHDAATRAERIAGARWHEVSPGLARALNTALEVLARAGLPVSPGHGAGSFRGLVAFSAESAGTLRRLDKDATGLAASLGLREPTLSLARAGEIAELALIAAGADRPESGWLNPALTDDLDRAVNTLELLCDEVNRQSRNLTAVFKDDVLKLDLQTLTARFTKLHKGLRKLLPGYWRDRKLLAPSTRTGHVTKDVIAALPDAVAWKETVVRLAQAETDLRPSVGNHYYKGAETKFSQLRRAVGNAKRVLGLVRGHVPQMLIEALKLSSAPNSTIALQAQQLQLGLRAWREAAAGMLQREVSALDDLTMAELATKFEASAGPLQEVGEALNAVGSLSGRDVTVSEATQLGAARLDLDRVERELAVSEQSDRALLFEAYRGIGTAWSDLLQAADWTRGLVDILDTPPGEAQAARLLSARVDPDPLRGALEAWTSAQGTVLDFFEASYAQKLKAQTDARFDEATQLLKGLQETTSHMDVWARFKETVGRLGAVGLGKAAAFCIERRLARTDVTGVLERAKLERWMDDLSQRDDRLQRWRTDERQQLVQSFRELDRKLIAAAAGEMIAACNARKPRSGVGAGGVILLEAEKKRKHRPVRQLLADAAAVVQLIKPCFMMSPLSVSQFLPSTFGFDVVIFDEASQVRPQDAVNAVYRGTQLIVAGDQKQLPPTSFFDSINADGDEEWHEDELEEFDSVLDLCKGSGAFPSLSLRWHYRSQHEDLIAFSNYAFYDGRLVTFASSRTEGEDVGLRVIRVSGTYRRGGARDNPVEAAAVVERVIHHRRAHPHLSVGVVAFSDAQAQAIEDALDRRRRDAPELNALQEDDRLEGFFVKNLESVQGDERDIIIFSVGYAEDEAGKFTMNFGPLNRAGGERRLNVAVTRARRRVEIVTSIDPSWLSESNSVGLSKLRKYLEYASTDGDRIKTLVSVPEATGLEAESPFEEEVARVIRSWGHDVVHQVGTAGYRVDLAVRRPGQPGRYVLGIECDGAMYHSSRVARDRDRLRHEILTGLGWRLHRIWGPAWYRERKKAEERLRHEIQDAINSPDPSVGQGRLKAPEPKAPPSEAVKTEPVALTTLHPKWARPYEVASLQVWTRGLQMHELAALDEVARLLGEVVRIEGPVHEEVALRRVRSAWGIGRAGARIREAFDRARRKAKVLRDERGFLFVDETQKRRGARFPVDSQPDTARTISEVSPSEIAYALTRFVADARGVGLDELTEVVARLFGWNRRGSDIASALQERVDALVRRGIVEYNGEGPLIAGPKMPEELLRGEAV